MSVDRPSAYSILLNAPPPFSAHFGRLATTSGAISSRKVVAHRPKT